MSGGVRGTFVIDWAQVRIDGNRDIEIDDLRPGAVFQWSGMALRIDMSRGAVAPEATRDGEDLNRRVARRVRRIGQNWNASADIAKPEIDEDRIFDRCFVLTDGYRAYCASHIAPGFGRSRAARVVFLGDIPDAETDLWVARVTTTPRADARSRKPQRAWAVGFVAGTEIGVPGGLCRVEDLQPGQLVTTRDNAAQPVAWTSMWQVTGSRLHIEPQLRPIRFAPGRLAGKGADAELRLAPGHRVVVAGRGADALFPEREVLVRARDLLGQPGVTPDLDCAGVTYVQVMFASHQIVSAAGRLCESFLPRPATLAAVPPVDRGRLEASRPGLLADPDMFGPPARRCLDRGEAAILTRGIG